jgi:hypothetical protein
MTVIPVAQSIGVQAADLSFVNFRDLANLVLGFALLVLLVLLVKEVSGSRR